MIISKKIFFNFSISNNNILITILEYICGSYLEVPTSFSYDMFISISLILGYLEVFSSPVEFEIMKFDINIEKFFCLHQDVNYNHYTVLCISFLRKKRMSTGALNFYPLDDNDDDLLGPKKSDPVEETMQTKELVRQETAPSIRLQQRLSLKNRAVSALFDSFILVKDNKYVDPIRW